ncbi:MAG: ISL3 family transposase [Proteobacteria bacterium]|nr:ISL3 family transposase [Pseudomonadota bacterium]
MTGYHSSQWTKVEDLPISGKRVYLHIWKRRYRCPHDGKIHTEEIPWLKKWGRVTKRFAEHVSRLTAITTNQEAGWFLGLNDEAVYRIDKEILEEKAKDILSPPPAAIHISVDEVSYQKYHRYLTNVIDTDRKLLIWNEKGRKSEVLNKYFQGIGEDNCTKIESVALDGARHYISSSIHYAVNALIVYDKFHVMQKLNNAVDAVRKHELRKARIEKDDELVELINCKQRFILFKKKGNLTARQTSYLTQLCELNEPIYRAMLLKESFLTVYSCKDEAEARTVLHNWIQEAASSTMESFIALANSFTDKMQYILNWFKKKVSSAISEGFNNKIKRLKRMAYGYKDIDYFRLKIHQHCGLLNPRLNPINAT